MFNREPKVTFTFAKWKLKSKKTLKWNGSESQKWKMCENETKAKTKYETLFSPKPLIKSDIRHDSKYLIQLNIKRDIY